MMFAPFLAGVMWLGASGGGTHYDKTPAEVRSALQSALVPLHVLGGQVTGSRVTRLDDETMVTSLLDEGENELMRFVTTVSADGEGSRVETIVEAPKGVHAKRAEETMKKQAIAVSLLELVAQEHVASAIEGRPFNMLALNPAANAMVNAMPETTSSVDDSNAATAEWSRLQQQGYGETRDNGWGSPNGDYGGDWGSQD
ncbi:hypothetical protein [Parerythrobacter aestuarii]|uniref:hypothetical protein n=1 Tax=Parerythrobacter aestuarii TaxID=3020909 RepID=UPI0024DEE19B|nr:hypothetical protein [Parerythrobacter aestuarii]